MKAGVESGRLAGPRIVRNGFIEGRSPRRLVTRNGVSVMGAVPLVYGSRIQALPGVKRVAATLMFGGVLLARKEGASDKTKSLPERSGRRRG